MEIVEENGIWVARSRYEERHIPKAAGFRWNPARKVWWTDDREKAAKLAALTPEQAAAELAERQARHDAALAASRATDADVDLPAPDGLEYLPYQRAGIAFALGKPAVLIGDDMGLGKTIQAIGIWNADPTLRRALVICPASLKINWSREWSKWSVRPVSVGIADGQLMPMTDVVIVNFDVLHKWERALREDIWDLLVVDEAHFLKNPKARRTVMVCGGKLAGREVEPLRARRRVLLTGTPIPNRPIEAFPLLHYLDPETWRSSFAFGKRYCAGFQQHVGRGRYVWDFSGSSRLDELQDRLRSTIMVRRLKSEVLTDLPPKRRQVVELDPGDALDVVERENARWVAFEDQLAELEAQAELAKASEDEDEYSGAVERLNAARQVAFTEMARLRHDTAVAKVPVAAEFIRDALEESGKIVVFAHHVDVIQALAAEFGDEAVTLTGATSMEDRQRAVDRFQTDPSVRVFIGNILAAGVGLTLTAASRVIFVELDWVPGNVTQAEDRCHRIGQRDSVLVQHLVFDGSLDAKMAKTLVAKQDVIDRALDIVEKAAADEPVTSRSASRGVSRDDLAEVAATLSVERVRAIHAALRALSAYCDGARNLDGMGFSRVDVGLGHSLAKEPRLTARQAALGQKLVRKYRRQLPAELVEAALAAAAPQAA